MMPTRKQLLLSALILSYLGQSSGQIQVEDIVNGIQDVVNGVKFMDCEPSLYYESLLQSYNGGPLQWTREGLQALLKARHRNILPVNSEELGGDDVYEAIKDLDPGVEPGTLQLVYLDVAVNATPQIDHWEVERLWSLQEKSDIISAFTDVHNLRPIDVNVLENKDARNFGMCNNLASLVTCTISTLANTGSETTAQFEKLWQPPQSKRGEIARALLYMDLRYSELTLEDCHSFGPEQLGYLSHLLQWHREYPPEEGEIQRNNQACSRWQGNRNPFVDFPELAELLHGSPQELIYESRTYPSCVGVNQTEDILDLPSDIESTISDFLTSGPSASPSVKTNTSEPPSAMPSLYTESQTTSVDPCASIGNGSLPFFLVNTRDPDEVVILALEKIAGGMELYLTDQAWDGDALVWGELDEGTVYMTTPEDGIPEGGLFGFGPQAPLHDRWKKDQGTFSLGLDGDNIFLYCLDAANQVRFLSAFSNAGDWKPPFLEEYGRNSTALPDSLVKSSIALPHRLSYHYNGARDARINLLRRGILEPWNWEGSNELRYTMGEMPVQYITSGATSSRAIRCITAALGVVALLILK